MKRHPFQELQTERLHLRKLGLSNANEILELRSNPIVTKFISRQKPKTIADAYSFIHKVHASKNYYWVIGRANAS